MRRLIVYMQSLFIRHEWDDPYGEQRVCTVCGRREAYDYVSSANGTVWICEWKGHPQAHSKQFIR